MNWFRFWFLASDFEVGRSVGRSVLEEPMTSQPVGGLVHGRAKMCVPSADLNCDCLL